MITAAEFQEKHNRRLKAAITDMESGVNRVSVSPTSEAAKKQAKMIANLTARVNDGTWAARLNKVPLDEWKSKMISKGLPRVAGGIDAAAGKVVDFANQLLPFVATAQAKVKAMPDMTIEDSVNRASTMIREMSKFRKK